MLNIDRKKTNRLINEKSPYLLQHAYNPVDWFPWGDEAFDTAKREVKPILLSVGYSTCHWCHVMEKESFEDAEVADLINETFIPIKVDREERPDIDNTYMAISQLLTGRGGWPLTIFMTPEKKPFFAATYLPKHQRANLIGLMDLIPKIRMLWLSHKEDIEKTADKIIDSLRSSDLVLNETSSDENFLEKAYSDLSGSFDKENGGFNYAPKFPTPHKLMFLLRYWKRSRNQHALSMAAKTLDSMHRGGIFDQIGFGSHRYSTDPFWKLPHFEKMLYDQALLVYTSSEAYQATGTARCKDMAEQIIGYVQRELTSLEGAFYSAEDADSEGKEGKYYLWTKDEIETLLSKQDTDIFEKFYAINPEGNFFDEATGQKTGNNLIYQPLSWQESASKLGMPENILRNKIESIRIRLLQKRATRVKPLRDDKVLTDWNGLMIAALAKASQAFEKPEYVEAAQHAMEFISDKMHMADGGLYHRYRDGESSYAGYADDYAFLIWGLLELYEAVFQPVYLEKAFDLNTYFIKHFWDTEKGGFFFSSDLSESLFTRRKELYDGAVPSANSVQALNLHRLARISGSVELENMASQMIATFSGEISKYPAAYSYFLCALDFAEGPAHEIIIVGKRDAPETKKMLRSIQKNFIPNKIVLFVPAEESDPKIHKIAPYTGQYPWLDNRATIFLCQNYSCQQPTHDINKILENLVRVKNPSHNKNGR
ncbi:MAG: thioredoxin domain-containing protein [Candidatus Aminicenantes bacterium]|nr:thioredoxin domain-containing protein [Candidatus Aminicenantes bacterium]